MRKYLVWGFINSVVLTIISGGLGDSEFDPAWCSWYFLSGMGGLALARSVFGYED